MALKLVSTSSAKQATGAKSLLSLHAYFGEVEGLVNKNIFLDTTQKTNKQGQSVGAFSRQGN